MIVVQLYIVLSYLVLLGMIIQSYDGKETPAYAWCVFILAPFVLPILIGMMLIDNYDKSNK